MSKGDGTDDTGLCTMGLPLATWGLPVTSEGFLIDIGINGKGIKEISCPNITTNS